MSFKICGRNPLLDDPQFNLTYDQILAMDTDAFRSYITYMRERIRQVWVTEDIAPTNGWTEEDVTSDFKQLSSFPVHEFWRTCELTGNRVIHNTHVHGNSVNAWNLHRMLKVRINYTEKDNGRSIFDFFEKDELFKKYLPYARRHFLRDSFYFFAQSVKRGDRFTHRPDVLANTAVEYCRGFAEHERAYNSHELLIEAKAVDKGYSGYADKLRDAHFFALTYDELQTLAKAHILTPLNLRVLRKKELNAEHVFHVRLYKKGQKLFPAMWKSFRVSMCQYAVNFPPLTAKLLYQTFLKDVPGDELRVWDPSAGWAGRLLGAMSSELPNFQRLHYLGTDPNPEFYDGDDSVYGAIGRFYTDLRRDKSLWSDDEGHRFTMFCSGSETVQFHPEFRRHRGELDLVFTSPPYFNREAYSEDVRQSYKAFPTYESWRDGFLRETLTTAHGWLKPNRYLLWNIADVKVGKKYLPLQQDSIAICKELGMEYVETIYMTLRGMPGANRVNEDGELTAKNMCKLSSDGKLYKYEPILVFKKP
jgi:hypothetical protein